MNQTSFQLLAILANGGFHSGEKLAATLGLTRAAINKSIRKIESSGLLIDAKYGKGYQLRQPVELLDKGKIVSSLKQRNVETGYEVHIKAETGSTNDDAYLLLQSSNADTIVLMAEYQTQGRGRRGNQWVSPLASGIYLSFARRIEVVDKLTGLMSLIAGIAVIRALKQAGIRDAGLKWPNDILIEGKKLGGVLLEMHGEEGGPLDMIIGIGLNYQIPSTLEVGNQPVTDICDQLPIRLSRNHLCALLIFHLLSLLSTASGDNKTSILNEWRQYDCCHGKPGKLLLPDAEINGMLRGIDDQGHLLMETDGVIHHYLSGEVSLRVD